MEGCLRHEIPDAAGASMFISLSIDAEEEADRLPVIDAAGKLCFEPELAGWNGTLAL